MGQVGKKTFVYKKSFHHYGANCRKKNIVEQKIVPSLWVKLEKKHC